MTEARNGHTNQPIEEHYFWHIKLPQPISIIDHYTHLFKTTATKRAVVLVAPGLNLKPLAMAELIKVLNKAGVDCCLINFSESHHPQSDPSLWEKEFIESYQTVRSLADEQVVPLYFMGYSLGALLGNYLLSSQPLSVRFDKQVLIAPATAIRLPRLLKTLISLLTDRLRIPSYAPKNYRINSWLPAKVYKLMINWERTVEEAQFSNLNIPSLVLIDPKDELISYALIKKQIEQYHLTNYQCIVLDSDLKKKKYKLSSLSH